MCTGNAFRASSAGSNAGVAMGRFNAGADAGTAATGGCKLQLRYGGLRCHACCAMEGFTVQTPGTDDRSRCRRCVCTAPASSSAAFAPSLASSPVAGGEEEEAPLQGVAAKPAQRHVHRPELDQPYPETEFLN